MAPFFCFKYQRIKKKTPWSKEEKTKGPLGGLNTQIRTIAFLGVVVVLTNLID